jgi:glutathione S-transferase
MPEDPAARAEVRMLVKRFEEDLSPKMYAVMKDGANGSAKKDLHEELVTWNETFAGRTFAVGDDVTEADIMIYTMFPLLKERAGFEVGADLPALRAWLDRMAARPTTRLPHPRAA